MAKAKSKPKKTEATASESKKAAPADKPRVKLTVAEAAQVLGISPLTTKELFEEGRLPAVKSSEGKWTIVDHLLKRAVDGEFKQRNEKYPAIWSPGRGNRLAEFNGSRMWVAPGKTKRCSY
jgi:excisionase family DNA binding protein